MVNDFQGNLELGRMVEGRRVHMGMSRQELGDLTGLSYNMIAKIELGRRRIPEAAVRAIADALGFDVDALYAASGVLPPDIQGRVKDATAEQIKAVRQIMAT
jgi:transcriptional regulator with XRE-family HTH domain